MKVFITFLALLILGTWAMVFQGDFGEYNHEQLLLKEAAEECAAGAALFLDEGEYSQGRIVFDYEEGRKYTENYLAYIKRNSKALLQGQISWNMGFEDEKQGYGASNQERIPAVTVELSVKTKDLFRLPFLSVTKLERSARYELPEEIQK